MRAPPPRRPLILVVDDDPGVLDALRLTLGDLYDVLDARDGNTALKLLQAGNVDLVVLDLLIEGIDGITLLERLRILRIAVPVLILSGINTAWAAAAAMRLGAIDYLTKPFEEAELLTVIASALRHSAGAAELWPRERVSRLLLIGCPIGLTAVLTASLAAHARVDSVPADRLDGALSSPDTVVLDLGGPDPGGTVARVVNRFPLSSIIAINAPATGMGGVNVAATALARPTSFRELFAELAASLRPSVRPLPRFSARVLSVMSHVSTHVADVRIEELGRALGMSPYYLSRLFRAETGTTLKAYLNLVRVEAARQLLLDTDDKIETVATRVGFHDGSHLSRLFLRYSGHRPGSVRQGWSGDFPPLSVHS